jgi:hypothetical protein
VGQRYEGDDITMTKILSALAVVALCSFGLASTGCNPNSIGRPCINANQNMATGTQIASPALECPSRLCLIQATTTPTAQGNSRNTCTAGCESDGDCDAETTEYCQSGFRCAVATQVGRFCCKKFCVCNDDLTPGFNVTGDPPNQVIVTPHSCDPTATDVIITCPNVKTK